MEDSQEECYQCKRCNENVDVHNKFASFEDNVWHEKCFYCDNCSTNLDNVPFSVQNQSDLICKSCYRDKFASVCDRCKNMIDLGEETFRYGERKWHKKCFNCDNCNEQLKPVSFWKHCEQIFCKQCYGKLHTENCEKCNEIIWKFGITFQGKQLHPDCFNCDNCAGNMVDKKFYSRENGLYCLDCFKQLFCDLCHKCSEYITGIDGEKMVSSEDMRWHTRCFLCTDCSKSLVGQNFVFRQGEIVCPDCKLVTES